MRDCAADPSHLCSVTLSDERLRQITNEQGTAVTHEHREQTEQVLQEAASMEQIHAQPAQARHAGATEPPECLKVGLDVGEVPSREQKGGMEDKIGVVASQAEVSKCGCHRLTKGHNVAAFGPADELGKLTYAAACELDATEAKQQFVLGDEAEWIKTQADEHFPDAVKILDWPHLWRKIRDAVRAV